MDSFKTDNSLNGNQMSDWLEVYNNEELNNSSSSLLESSNEEVYLSFLPPSHVFEVSSSILQAKFQDAF